MIRTSEMSRPSTGGRDKSLAHFLEHPTRFLFFTGKGGVGKTSLACTISVGLADRGARVLLVSTDPASNLDEVFQTELAIQPRAISGVPRLEALNIDPEAAARAYRERLVGPCRDKLPASIVSGIEEQLSGACTTEIAAFDEFARLLGDPAATAGYDHVIFDTAPTGHTLRLLSLPRAWTTFISTNSTGTSCLGPLAGLQKQQSLYESAVAALTDASRTTLILVSRPQGGALDEAERTSRELAAIGVRNQRLIVNGVFRNATPEDAMACALQERGARALEHKAAFLDSLPVSEVPLHASNIVGIDALRMLAGNIKSKPTSPGEPLPDMPHLESLSSLVDSIIKSGAGVVMTMGKGGVGKTTIAATIATELARRGLPVHLSTTDPAAHVAAAAGSLHGLEVSRIDPEAEVESYVAHVMGTAGKSLDASARSMLEEDLRSPCTQEIAVFRAFARTVAQGRNKFVILDTAPTGHTLLLLDATEAYHREIARKASDLPEEVLNLLPRLREPTFTRVLIVTLPEPTPVHEAAMLQADLRRAKIEPFAWVVNQSFVQADLSDPLLRARAAGELPFIREVAQRHASRTALVRWVPKEPVGAERLQQLLLESKETETKDQYDNVCL